MTGIIANVLSFLGLAKGGHDKLPETCPPDLVNKYCECSQTYTVMFWLLFGLLILWFLYKTGKRILKSYIGAKVGTSKS